MSTDFIDAGLDARWSDTLASEATLAEQTRACLANIDRIITAAGGQRTDIAAVTIYNTRLAEQDVVNAVCSEFFGEHRPARTHVEVSRLADPELLIEISAMAAL
ncbi:RidA family protein [Gryllotalpicola koreensis]|uniref:RidA family protein n=1 Tax=Gryllotalpicola koreensis TaxID=993086 RepID=A0ABP8A596_9MICO